MGFHETQLQLGKRAARNLRPNGIAVSSFRHLEAHTKRPVRRNYRAPPSNFCSHLLRDKKTPANLKPVNRKADGSELPRSEF